MERQKGPKTWGESTKQRNELIRAEQTIYICKTITKHYFIYKCKLKGKLVHICACGADVAVSILFYQCYSTTNYLIKINHIVIYHIHSLENEFQN